MSGVIMQTKTKGTEYDIGILSFMFNSYVSVAILSGGFAFAFFNIGIVILLLIVFTLLAMLLAFRTTSGFIAILLGFINVLWFIIASA